MVGPPDVDDLVEAAFELVQMVGNVGGEISVEAVLALDDAVLLVAERRRAEPAGAVLDIEMAFLRQQVDAAGNEASVVERLFGEPDVEMDAELFEIVAAIRQLFGQGMLMHIGPVWPQQFLGTGNQRIEMQFALLLCLVVGPRRIRQPRRAGQHRLGAAHVLGAVRLLELRRHVAHIAALVGIGRKRQADAVLVEVAQPGRQAEDVHLPAGVVDVILTGDIPAGEAQQARQRGAVGGPSTVTDVQRPGRVGRDEFDLHLLPAAQHRLPEALAVGEDRLDDAGLGTGIEPEVDEPRTRHLGLCHQR